MKKSSRLLSLVVLALGMLPTTSVFATSYFEGDISTTGNRLSYSTRANDTTVTVFWDRASQSNGRPFTTVFYYYGPWGYDSGGHRISYLNTSWWYDRNVKPGSYYSLYGRREHYFDPWAHISGRWNP